METTTLSIDAAIAAAVRQAVEKATNATTPTAPAPTGKTDRYCMTVKQLAERMQISLPNAYNLTHIENFPLIQLGRKRLIPIEAFEMWLVENSGRTLW